MSTDYSGESSLFGLSIALPSYSEHSEGGKAMTRSFGVLVESAISYRHNRLKLRPIPLSSIFELDEGRFGLDIEIRAKVLRAGFRTLEVTVSHVGGSKAGKKIRFTDEIRNKYVLVKARFLPVPPCGQRD